MSERPFPPVYPHGELEQKFDGVWFVTGSVKMSGGPPIRFSRGMTVIEGDGGLTLVNTVRLDDGGLAALDKLGEVKHVIRLAGFHGMDDPFYKDRYGATVSVVEGMVYAPAFGAATTDKKDGYFQPDVEMASSADLPAGLGDAELIAIDCKAAEGILFLKRDGGILISGDSLQNWVSTEFFSLGAKLIMRLMGFLKPHNVGPGWLKSSEPDRGQIKALLDLEWAHVLPNHGVPVIGDAREKYRPAIEKVTAKA